MWEPRFFTTKNTKNHQGCTKVANRPTLSNRVIGLTIDVHRGVGPSLAETVNQDGMCMEGEDAGIAFQSQAMVSIQDGPNPDLAAHERYAPEIPYESPRPRPTDSLKRFIV